MERQARRKNGFSRPFSLLQVGSWVTFAALAACFYPILSGIIEGAAEVFLGVVHIVLALGTVFLAGKTGGTDPIDSRNYNQYVCREGERLSFCHICKQSVRKESKHCRICDKCVDGFDHHCIWLNNCIGKKNYRSFLYLLGTAFFLVVLESIISLSACVLYVKNTIQTEEHIAFTVFVSIYLLVAVAASVAIGQLLFFHVYLVRSNKTTYDHIVQQMRKKQDLQKRQAQTGTSRNRVVGCCASSSGPSAVKKNKVASEQDSPTREEVPIDAPLEERVPAAAADESQIQLA